METLSTSKNKYASKPLLASSTSFTLRAPVSKLEVSKDAKSPSNPVIHGQQMAKVQKARASTLTALKNGYKREYYSKAEFSELNSRLATETDLKKIETLFIEIIDTNLLRGDLRHLKAVLRIQRDAKRRKRPCMWHRDRKWYVARALVMMKDATKMGCYDIMGFKENLKICLFSTGDINCVNVDYDILLKHSDDLKYRLRNAGHPAYQKGKSRRKHIRSCISNGYYATPIIP